MADLWGPEARTRARRENADRKHLAFLRWLEKAWKETMR